MLNRARAATSRSLTAGFLTAGTLIVLSLTTIWTAGAALTGCGGDDNNNANNNNNPDGSTDGSNGGQVDGSSDGGGDADANRCQELSQRIADTRPAATACDPSGADQCGQKVRDICCTVPVNDANSSTSKAFADAVSAYLAAKCPHRVCPQACIEQARCVANDGGTGGTCR